MAVPKYYEFMPSIMRCLSDNEVHEFKDIVVFCSNDLKLNDEDMAETIPSGLNTVRDRISWAKTYLNKAGFIQSPKRGSFILTELGREVYNDGPEKVTLDYLKQFQSFLDFYNRTPSSDNNKKSLVTDDRSVSPYELIEESIMEINQNLADELMCEIMKISPYDFERLVVKLLISMGYGKLSENKDAVTKKSGDEGIDGIVSADKFGFDSIYIQAKQWKPESKVSRPEIQKFLGALVGQGANKGIFITTAQFSREAVSFASKQLNCKIVLVDGQQLAKLMIEHNLGVSVASTYQIKRIDSDFFNEDI